MDPDELDLADMMEGVENLFNAESETDESSEGQERAVSAPRRLSVSSLDEFSQRNRPRDSRLRHQEASSAMIWSCQTAGATRYRQEGMAERTLAVLDRLRQERQMTDVTLVAGDVEVTAHRAVLAASSPYFYAMFTGFQEQYKDKVNLVDVDPESLRILVEYAYKTEVEVNEHNVQGLLSASSLLQMNDVTDACCDFLRTQLCHSNVLGFRSFADLHGCLRLVEDCVTYIHHNFCCVAQSEEFLRLSINSLADIVSCNTLNVPSEEKVYEAVMSWVNHDPAERKALVPELMAHVRLPLLSKEYLVLNVVDGLAGYKECNELVIDALRYHMAGDLGVSSIPVLSHRQPVDLPKMMLAIGGQAPKAIRSVEGYDFGTESWVQVSEMATRRCRCGVAVVKGRVYAVGGFNGSLRVRTVDEYDPILDVWTSVASMETRRSTLGVAVLDGHVYAVGGFDGSMGLSSAEVIDLTQVPSASEARRRSGGRLPVSEVQLSWRAIPSMGTRRSSVGVGVLRSLVFAVGGYDGHSRQCLQSVEVYYPKEVVWRRVADMSARRSGAAVGVLNSVLYAIGGHDGPIVRNSVECYDPSVDQWTKVADMNSCRRNAGAVTHKGLLYVIGGDDGSQNLTSVEVYNPAAGTWSYLKASMTLGRSYTGVCIIDKPENT